MWIPREIDALASRLQNGQRVKRITVRRLLRLFDAERRGVQKVQEIRNALNSLNLETYPDFEHAWIDSTIMIRLKEPTLSNAESDVPDLAAQNGIETQHETNGLQNGGGVDPSEEMVDAVSDDDTDQSDPENEDDENEEVSVREPITEPFDPTQIRIETKQLSLDSLISRMQNHEIILQPEFQRNEVWKRAAQSRLIESLLIRIPIPAFYMDATNDEKWLVVDGQQRLSTLRQFVIDKSNDRLRLTGLEFLGRDLNGADFDSLERPLQRRIKETNVTVYLIEKGTPPEVKLNVFKRINTGGLPLSAQEIRHALNGPKVNEMLKELAKSDEFLRATGGSVQPKRMADREYVIRFFAFLLKRPEGYTEDFDLFLSNAMKEINDATDAEREQWRERFLTAMRRSTYILGHYAFRKRTTFRDSERLLPVNKALFEAWSVNLEALSDDQVRELANRSPLMWEKFALLLDQRNRFYQAISQGTGDANRVRLRFEAIRQLIEEILA